MGSIGGSEREARSAVAVADGRMVVLVTTDNVSPVARRRRAFMAMTTRSWRVATTTALVDERRISRDVVRASPGHRRSLLRLSSSSSVDSPAAGRTKTHAAARRSPR
jgi:hypothetical protein